MHNTNRNSGWLTTKIALGIALAAIGGLAACGTAAHAQTPDSQNPDDIMIDPAPIGYPFSTPGGLDLWHWKSYRQITLAPGSTSDARYDKAKAEKMQKRDSLEHMESGLDPSDDPAVDPAPMGYPFSTPGGLDLNHWTDYKQINLKTGSAGDVRYYKHKKQMEAKAENLRNWNDVDEMNVDPAPVGYPFSTPGGLDLWHWRSYRRMTLVPGSVSDARYDKAKARHDKMMDHDHDNMNK